MKNIFSLKTIFIAICTIVIISGALSAFKLLSPEKSVCIETDATGIDHVNEIFAGVPQQKTYALDTLTGTSTNTVSVPWTMASNYQYSYYFKLRKVTGPTNTKVVLDAATASASSLWHPIDSFTVGGADSLKMHFILRGTAYDAKHRIRFVRTGAGKLARNIELTIKPL